MSLKIEDRNGERSVSEFSHFLDILWWRHFRCKNRPYFLLILFYSNTLHQFYGHLKYSTSKNIKFPTQHLRLCMISDWQTVWLQLMLNASSSFSNAWSQTNGSPSQNWPFKGQRCQLVTFCHSGSIAYTFLISDIRALWRSGLRARVPECQKLKM